jgi:hypothetical protein
MRVGHHTADICKVSVVLHRAHVQASLLAELCNAGFVVVGELTAPEDCVRDFWLEEQIDLNDLCLQTQTPSCYPDNPDNVISVYLLAEPEPLQNSSPFQQLSERQT